MADLTAHNSELTLPELVRFTLEHMRNLRLKGPSTLKDEHYAMIWRALSTASNKLVETIEELRFKGQEQWETGDDASYQQFGNISVPQGKEFLRDVIRELASLGTKWHTSSTSASIDTQRFDPDHVPRLVEFEAVIEDGKVEDVEPEDFKKAVPMKEAVKKDSTAPEFIKTEAIEPSPQDPVLSSIETHTPINSFKTPTAPRPTDYKTPPRGPSFSPITPPPQPAHDSSSTAPPHPPLQYPDDQRFHSYLSTIDFNFDDNANSMFEVPTPTDVQEGILPLPNSASQAPGPATGTAPTEQGEYMESVQRILDNIASLDFLLQPVPAQYTSGEG